MNQIKNNLDIINHEKMKMKYIAGELQGLRAVLAYLIGDDEKYRVEAFNAVYFLKTNYKQWGEMIIWLKRNNLVGKKLVEFFQNESMDGGGYHMGATHIINRIESRRFNERGLKVDELL